MKIAVWHNLPSGGGKRALYYHVKGLVERGHVVESWCPPTADQTYLPLSSLVKENIIPLDQPVSSNNPFNRVLRSYHQTIAQIHAMDRHSQQCAEEINQGNFDILLANPCKFFHTPIIGQYINIPTALYLQEPFRSFYEARPQLPWLALPSSPQPWYASPGYLKSFLRNLVEVQGLRVKAREELKNAKGFDLILVNSLFSRESILRSYGLESLVCYLGIDTDLFIPLNLPRKNTVIGLGTIYSGKGLDRAVRAVSTIEKTQRPTLLWVGNGADAHYQKEIENLAQSLEVDFISKVRVTDQELVSLLNQASAMIYTSRLEPFGFAPLEANACGTPVVAIAEGGIRETTINGVNGFLVNNDDPVAIGEAILKLLQNEPLAREMGQRARDYILNCWKLESAIDRLEKSLLSLTNRTELTH